MIFRKPYAFLIKNFKRIHIVILALCFFIYFRINSIISFIKEYIMFGTYNEALEPFSSHAGFLLYLSLLVVIISSFLLMVLLRRKDKPWKIYLLYIFCYLLLFIGVILTNRYFASYSLETSISGVLIYRDLLRIGRIFQYPIFVLLIIRILGIDLKKFNFTNDKEFLELSSEDREEFEISFEFDKNSIIRLFNRTKRNLYYFYLEHKYICNIVIIVLSVYIIFQGYYYFGVSHRSYKEGDTFQTNGYQITIKDSFITDKDLTGKKIEKDYNFVVITMKMKNNREKIATPNLGRFHLMNGNIDRVYTTYYNTYFTDIGSSIDGKFTLSPAKSREFYLVYKVKNNLRKNRFVLYYQELGGKMISYLRKIKLNIEDVSKIENAGTYKINDKITFSYINKEKKILTPTSYEIGDSFNYNRYYCPTASVCSTFLEEIKPKNGNKILKISFASSDFEGEEFIDFSIKYGRIKYKDSSGKTRYSDIESALNIEYQGKDIFITAKSEILDSKSISIVYTLRNKKYTLKIK